MARALESRRPGAVARRSPRTGLGLDLTASTTAAFSSEVQSRLSAAGTQTQALLYQQTGIDTTNARVGAGAQAALSLAQNGYNPSSPADNANLVHAIAGGLCLIPGAGPLLGAAVEGLWLLGNQIACPVVDAFAAIGMGQRCDAPPCASSGNWTAESVLSGKSQNLPAMPSGSFAELAVGALATYAAQSNNCKGGMPPDVIVDSAVAIWNKTHAGPATDYLVPPLCTGYKGAASSDIIPTAGSGNWGATGGKDPWAYYAFSPATAWVKGAFAAGQLPFPIAPAPLGLGVVPARLVSVNTGPLLSTTSHPPYKKMPNGDVYRWDAARNEYVFMATAAQMAALQASVNAAVAQIQNPPLSTGAKVAIGTATVAGGAFVAGSLYALVQHQAVGYFWGKLFDGAWRQVKGIFR